MRLINGLLYSLIIDRQDKVIIKRNNPFPNCLMHEKNKKFNNKSIYYVLSMSKKILIAEKYCYDRVIYLSVLP